MFAKRSSFNLERVPTSELPASLKFATLKSEYIIYDLLGMGFFDSPNIEFLKNKIKKEKLRLHRAYVNLSTAQDTYFYHVDSYYDNEPTLLYYLNTYWLPHWEGETHFSEDAKDICYSTSLIPNRLVLFSATIPHKTSQPSFHAEEYRYVLTIKFSSSNTPDHKKDFPISDLFIDDIEPDDDEKNAIDFLEKNSHGLRHSGTTFFNHCLNVFKILKSHGAPKIVCLAGLYHSIYGTEFYEKIELNDRSLLKNIIGSEAEDIVYRFCSLQDRDSYLLHPNCLERDLIHIAYANFIDEIKRNQCSQDEIINYKNKLEEIK